MEKTLNLTCKYCYNNYTVKVDNRTKRFVLYFCSSECYEAMEKLPKGDWPVSRLTDLEAALSERL